MDGELIAVGIARAGIARPPQRLAAYALGSCVAICLHDRKAQVAGMAHILLPDSGIAAGQDNPYKFADSGLEALICEMRRCGALRDRLRAKLAGGAEMFGALYAKTGGIGEKNSAAAQRALVRCGIPLAAQDVGADYGRTIIFSAQTGLLTVRSIRYGELTI